MSLVRERSLLDLPRFLIKERVALFGSSATFLIFNPETELRVGIAREDPGVFIRLLRWVLPRRWLPTRITVHELDDDDSLLCTVYRRAGLWRSRIEVCDADENLLGYFQKKLFSVGGGFWVHDALGHRFAEVRGDLKGWNFHFRTPHGREVGLVTKEWGGIGKELFTSADSWIVDIDYELAHNPLAKMLILAAALVIDLVYTRRS